MKKILYVLTIILYANIFILTFNQVRKESFYKLTFHDYSCIEVYDWNSECDIESKKEEIRSYAVDNHINILNLSYDTEEERAIAYPIEIECFIGDENEFCECLNMDDKYLREEKWCLSNRNVSEITYQLDTFYNDSRIVLSNNFEEKQEILGRYLVSGDAKKFANDMGFKYVSDDGYTMNYYTYLIIVLLLLLGFVYFMSYVYFVLKNSDEVAVRKLCGWSNGHIDIELFMKRQILMQIIGIGGVTIVSCIILYMYNNGNGIGNFYLAAAKNGIPVFFVIVLLFYIVFCLVKKLNIKNVLKDGKQEKNVQVLNYLIKFLVAFTLVGFSIYLFANIHLINQYSEDKKTLEKTKQYVTLELNSVFAYSDELEKLADVAKKCKDLYELEDKKGGILSYCTGNVIGDAEIMYINSNYLNENEIYLANGNRAGCSNEDEVIDVLIPETYSGSMQEIKQYCEQWLEQQTSAETIYEMYGKDYKKTNLENVVFHYIYVKEGQKYFSYGIEEMYVKDPIALVVNQNNVSKDSMITFFVTQSYFGNMAESVDMIADAKEDIKECNLFEEIQSVEKLSSVFSYKVNNVSVALRNSILICFIFLWMILLLDYMLCETYLQKNKFIHAVKKLHGYGFYARHNDFIKKNLILYFVVFILYFLGERAMRIFIDVSNVNYFAILCLAQIMTVSIDSIVSAVTIHICETKVIKDALKG